MAGKGKKTPWKKVPSFEKFIQYKRNEGKSVNELKRSYRNAGGRIGNVKANEKIRTVFDREKQAKKQTRFKYYNRDNSPTKKQYLRDNRYHYIVKYKVELANGTKDLRYATVISKEKRSKDEVVRLLEDMHSDLMNGGDSAYNPIAIDEDSIEVLYAVDTH